METNTEKLFKEAMEALEKDDNLLFIDDVVAACGVCRATFYKYIAKDSEEYAKIWEAITENRIKVKQYIRLKLRISGKAAELLSLYRMICTDEERRAINQQYVEMSSNGENAIKIEFFGGGERKGLPHSEDEVDMKRRRV